MLVKHDTDCELGLNDKQLDVLHSWQAGQLNVCCGPHVQCCYLQDIQYTWLQGIILIGGGGYGWHICQSTEVYSAIRCNVKIVSKDDL